VEKRRGRLQRQKERKIDPSLGRKKHNPRLRGGPSSAQPISLRGKLKGGILEGELRNGGLLEPAERKVIHLKS